MRVLLFLIQKHNSGNKRGLGSDSGCCQEERIMDRLSRSPSVNLLWVPARYQLQITSGSNTAQLTNSRERSSEGLALGPGLFLIDGRTGHLD